MGIKYLWRLSVLALCFSAFGIGGILMRIFLFPLMRFLPGTAAERQMRSRRYTHACFGLLVRTLCSTGAMTLEVIHPERLREAGGKLVLANHPSYLDVVVMFALAREINCVVKQALWNNRYFGGVVREVGYVSNVDADSLVDDCAAVLAKGESLLVFPEGTRTEPNMPIHLQRGAARIALRAGCEIVPVIFHCYPQVWGKGFRISRIARCQFHIRVEVKSPLRVTDLGVTETEEARAARQLTRNLETYFLREITSYERPASGNKATHHRIVESGRSET